MNVSQTWEYSPQTEAARLLHCAHQISRHFYQINNFLVLPQPPKKLLPTHVIFPDIPYSKLFWSTAKTLDYSAPINPPDTIVTELKPHLSNYAQKQNSLLHPEKPFKPEAHPFHASWQKLSPEVLDFLDHLIPNLEHRLHTIRIRPSLFGTQASFNSLYNNRTSLEIYLRFDAGTEKIVEVIFDALERQTLIESYNATWHETELVSDWLIGSTKLKQLIAKYSNTVGKPLVSELRTKAEDPTLKEMSQAFLTKLGYFLESSPLSMEGNTILFNHTPINQFTRRERALLIQLIERKNLTTDEVADIIFESDEEYSLYTIAKCIQRLRDKLEGYGLSGSCIQTIRGYGYSLR